MTINELTSITTDLDHARMIVKDIYISSGYTLEESINKAYNNGLISPQSYRLLHTLISA